MAGAYVTLDTMKMATNVTQTYVDLTPYFQGRVGDSMANVNLRMLRGGVPYNLNKYTVSFTGVDPEANKFIAVGKMRFDQPGASPLAGTCNFYFPAAIFRVKGKWDVDNTFFDINDESGRRVSTINVLINVFDGMVEMAINADDYKNPMDKAVAEVQDYAKQKKAAIDDLAPQVKELSNAIDLLNTRLGTYEQMINDKAVPTTDEMQSYVLSLIAGKAWSQDLNLAVNAGNYLCADSLSNEPGQKGGILQVVGDDSKRTQLLICTDSNAYYRVETNGAWTDWHQITTWN